MLKPEQIRSHRFISAGRGTYEASDVDAFLREVSASYEQVFRENGDLVNKISLLADIARLASNKPNNSCRL